MNRQDKASALKSSFSKPIAISGLVIILPFRCFADSFPNVPMLLCRALKMLFSGISDGCISS